MFTPCAYLTGNERPIEKKYYEREIKESFSLPLLERYTFRTPPPNKPSKSPFPLELSSSPFLIPIEKPHISKSPRPVIKYSPPSKPPILPESVPIPASLYFSKKPRKLKFTPYSIKDYRVLKDKKYQLGGLGPYKIGSEVWEIEYKKKRLMHDYARSLKKFN